MPRHREINFSDILNITPSNCLLDLPTPVRQKIYAFAGLLDQTEIHIWHNEEELVASPYPPEVSKFEIAKLDTIPLQLFHVSRNISRDAREMFYASNTFFLHGIRALEFLKRIGRFALSSLEHLSIEVTVDQCPCSTFATPGRGPLGSDTGKVSCGQPLIREWEETATLLALYGPTNKLHLEFDVRCPHSHYRDTFYRAMLAKFYKLPLLKSCTVRFFFYGKTNPDLQIAIEDVVNKTTERQREYPPFRYNDLPEEIQLMILERTDLVTSQDVRCWTAGDSNYCRLSDLRCCNSYTSENPGWRIPYAMFRANKALREQANYIFYSKNRFILEAIPDFPGPHYGSTLKDFVPLDCIQHLRRIDLELPLMYSMYFVNLLMQQNWHETVNLLAQHANLRRLVLKMTVNHSNIVGCHIIGPEAQDGFDALIEIFKDVAALHVKKMKVQMIWPPPPKNKPREKQEFARWKMALMKKDFLRC